MDDVSPKQEVNISKTKYIPHIHNNLPPRLASKTQLKNRILENVIASKLKGLGKSSVVCTSSNETNQDLKQKIPINCVFRTGGARLSNYLHTSRAPVFSTTRRISGRLLQRADFSRNKPHDQVNGPTETSIITFGSPLPPCQVVECFKASTCRTTPRNPVEVSGLFNRSSIYYSADNEKGSQNLRIEGTRTGEECVIDITNLHPRKEYAPESSPSFNRDEQCQRFNKLESQCRDLRNQLQKKSLRVERMHAIFELRIQESMKRSHLECDYWVEREKHMQAFLNEIHQKNNRTVTQIKADCMLQLGKLQKKLQSLSQQLEECKSTKHDAQAQEVQRRAIQLAEKEKLKRDIEQLKLEIENQCTKFVHERQSLSIEVVELRDAEQRLAGELRATKNQLAEQDFMIQQCRIFLKHICQPSFHVVKGTSLEPVEANRPEPTGFVLVPLDILLHGYSLLPIKERDDVIQQYEQKSSELFSDLNK